MTKEDRIRLMEKVDVENRRIQNRIRKSNVEFNAARMCGNLEKMKDLNREMEYMYSQLQVLSAIATACWNSILKEILDD